MDRGDVILVVLFVLVIVAGSLLILFDPSKIGRKNETIPIPKVNPQAKPYIPPEQRPSGLVYEKPTENIAVPEDSNIPIEETPPPPVPNQSSFVESANQTPPFSEPITSFPKTPLPTTSSPNVVCDTMCKFRGSVMDTVEQRADEYYCTCQNGYGRSIGDGV